MCIPRCVRLPGHGHGEERHPRPRPRPARQDSRRGVGEDTLTLQPFLEPGRTPDAAGECGGAAAYPCVWERAWVRGGAVVGMRDGRVSLSTCRGLVGRPLAGGIFSLVAACRSTATPCRCAAGGAGLRGGLALLIRCVGRRDEPRGV